MCSGSGQKDRGYVNVFLSVFEEEAGKWEKYLCTLLVEKF
jgi:hypothetical protein